MTLDCFVCGKTLKPSIPLAEGVAGQLSPPYRGTRFTSRGNYGSFFDPATDTEFMELNVCDACLLAAAQDGRVAYGRSSLAVHVEYEAFDVQGIAGAGATPKAPAVEIPEPDPES